MRQPDNLRDVGIMVGRAAANDRALPSAHQIEPTCLEPMMRTRRCVYTATSRATSSSLNPIFGTSLVRGVRKEAVTIDQGRFVRWTSVSVDSYAVIEKSIDLFLFHTMDDDVDDDHNNSNNNKKTITHNNNNNNNKRG